MKIFLISLIFVAACQAQNLPGISLTFYGTSLSDTQSIDSSNSATFAQLSTPYYDPARKNFIFIQGWQPGATTEARDLVIGAYLNSRRTEFNIINLEWTQYAARDRIREVISSINPVTATANQILTEIQAQGFDLAKTHIAGFSFGVLIAGGIGRYWRTQQPSVLIPRITALDPPEFYQKLTPVFAVLGVRKLSINDAKFVDVIHTNAGKFGDALTNGHANFWPNSGVFQPGCSIFNFDVSETGKINLNFIQDFFNP